MKLIQCREWLGPNYRDPKPSGIAVIERVMCFATHLPLPEALQIIVDYQRAFNAKNAATAAIEYNVLCVSEIEDCEQDLLDSLGVLMVEEIPDRESSSE